MYYAPIQKEMTMKEKFKALVARIKAFFSRLFGKVGDRTALQNSSNALNPSTIPSVPDLLPHIVANSTRAYIGNQGPSKPVEAIDRSGYDLGVGGGSPKVNAFAAGEVKSFTFRVLGGGSPEINVMGAPGKMATFAPVIDSIPGVRPEVKTQVLGDVHKVRLDGIRAGTYTYHVKVAKPGVIAVQFTQ